jgi:hypothetical protein
MNKIKLKDYIEQHSLPALIDKYLISEANQGTYVGHVLDVNVENQTLNIFWYEKKGYYDDGNLYIYCNIYEICSFLNKLFVIYFISLLLTSYYFIPVQMINIIMGMTVVVFAKFLIKKIIYGRSRQ